MIENYNVYEMSARELVLYYMFSFMGIACMAWLFFDSTALMFALMPIAFIFEKTYARYLAKKRLNKLYGEFSDFLYSISSSIAVGKDMREALSDAYNNLCELSQEDSLMGRELLYMLRQIECTNKSEKELLLDFAKRTRIEDVRSFIEVYYICRDSGGNLIKAVNRSVQIITDKVLIEKDIKVFISQKVFEGRLITALPPAIILFLKVLSPEYLQPLYETGAGRLVMLGSSVCMGFSYWFSEKLTAVAFAQTLEGGLPELLGRMSLLLSAGMVTETVFEKLAIEGKDSASLLMRTFANLYEESMKNNISMIQAFRQFASSKNSRPLMRIANILADNISKGTELVEKLDNEAQLLWHLSKKEVEEKGKLAETKLSFPMGLMLIVVIIITTAPALMTL